MRPERHTILDYGKPPPAASGWGSLVVGFLAGWLLGTVIASILGNAIIHAGSGESDKGVTGSVAAYAIVIEAPVLAAIRLLLGPRRVNERVACIFGLACGPLVTAILLL